MGRMSDLHIEMQGSGMLDDYPPTCLTTETLANEILFHFQGRGVNALELRNLIQELLDRHMTVFYQP